MTDRCIATRLVEACADETIACFSRDARLTSLYSDGRSNWRVHPWPLLPHEQAQIPLPAVRLVLIPTVYQTGVGGAATTEYAVTWQWLQNLDALKFNRGARSWYDDIIALRRWLYQGGTHPNATGSVADPDYTGAPGQHQFLTVQLTGFQFRKIGALLNRGFTVEYDATWQTYEDSQGNRV